MERIGVAFTRPKGATRRRDEYGIYVVLEAYGVKIEDPTLHVKYEGYREQREDGEAMVGLPLAGPNAAHLQPMVKFYPGNFERVRFFKEGPWSDRFR